MKGFIINKEEAIKKEIVSEDYLPMLTEFGDSVIITDFHITNFETIVSQFNLKVHDENELINLITNE